jgi:asparagine synthase (glutamine-hydrolysing)
LHHYLTWHSVVPAPCTILKGVRKLAPGTFPAPNQSSGTRHGIAEKS